MKRAPLIPSLNGGELSPLLNGRADIDKFATGAQTLENLIPKVQGPIDRRGGSVFLGSVKTPAQRTALQRFYFSADQAYVLEIGPLYMRFWTQRGQLLDGDEPYELAHDYNTTDLFAALGVWLPSSVQVRDVMFFARASKRPKVLSRLGATNWTWADFEFVNGPFKEENDTETAMVVAALAPGETGGTVIGLLTTITASAAVFSADRVGGLLELRGTGQAQTPPWKQSEAVTAGTARINDGRAYVAVNAATTGAAAPTHTEGDVSDGAVVWRYAHARRTTFEITAVALDGLSATVRILSWVAGDFITGVGAPVATWSWGAWSVAEGWPTRVGLFRERLVFARGRTLWLSCAGDYANFAARTGGEILTENAITVQIAVGRADEILWLQGADVLLAGTEGGVVIVREQTAQLPFGPGNVKAIPGPAIGAADRPPLEVPGGRVLYLDRTRTALRAIEYSADSDTFNAPDATRLAEHVLRPRVIALAYQAHRDSLIWCLRIDGCLAALTWDSQEGVYAWARHALTGGAVVEDIAVIPSPGDELPRDDLWVVARRTINGETVRYVEVLESAFVAPERRVGETLAIYHARVSFAAKHATLLDSALTYDGARAQSLDIPSTAVAVGEEFAFASSGGFGPTDVNRIIQHDYEDDAGRPLMAQALIVAVDEGGIATAIIQSAFPLVDGATLAAGSWRVTAATFTGLDHLEGKEVGILGDGAPYPRQTVVDGSITIDPPAGVVKVGLPYKHRFIGMPVEIGAAAGTSQGRLKRVVKLKLRVFASLGGMAGTREDDLREVRDLLPYRDPATPLGQANPLFFGDAELVDAGGFDTESPVVIEGDDPTPFTLLALIPEYEV